MALSQAQIDALNGVTDLTPDQSATALGHATNAFSNTILGAPQRIQQGGQQSFNVGSFATGMAKEGTSFLSGANSLDASAKLGGGTTLQDVTGVDLNKATQAQNFSEALGKSIVGAAEFGVGTDVAATELPDNVLSNTATSVGSKIKNTLADVVQGKKASIATRAVQSTAETMTKGERLTAIAEGRMPKAGKYVASQTEQRAGELLQGKVGSNPVKNVPIIQSEIAQRGTAAEQFLGENGRPVPPDQLSDVFAQKRSKVEAYMTPAQMKDYDHTIAQFESELSKMTDVNTGTIYKALKNFEQNVTARLPKGTEALLTDSGSAKLEAAKMVRSGVREMISAMHPEFSGQMFDLTSLYDALDNTIAKAEKATPVIKPILKKAATWGAEAVGAGALYEGAKEIGVPLP